MKLSKLLKFWKWFGTPPTPATGVNDIDKVRGEKKEFSTDLVRERLYREGELNRWIAQNAFQKTHSDIKTFKKSGAITTDSTNDSTSDSVKGAYSLSSNGISQVVFAWYVQQGFIGYQACAILAQQWLINKACKVPAEDAVKKDYRLTVNDGVEVKPDIITELRNYDKKYNLHKNLVEFARFNRVFGIRIALFNVESSDDDYYTKPFNIDGVMKGSYRGISQVDPYWVSPEFDDESIKDPASSDFYEPTWWRIAGKRYHRSHLIVIRYSDVADILKPSYMYGGVPLPQEVYERVYAAERTANEAPQLALTKRTNVVRTNTEKAMQNQKKFEERLLAFNRFRDNYGIFAIDNDEEFNQTDTTLTDLDALIMTQYQLVAAIAKMPSTKLLGTSPKGFNTTGEFETATYYDLLEGIQNDDSKLLERHYTLLIKSLGYDLFDFDIVWEPLKSPSPQEISAMNFQDSQTDMNLEQAGAIDGNDVRNRIISNPYSGYNGLETIDDE